MGSFRQGGTGTTVQTWSYRWEVSSRQEATDGKFPTVWNWRAVTAGQSLLGRYWRTVTAGQSLVGRYSMTVTAGAKSRVGRYKRGGTGERLLAGRREGGTGEKILTRRYCWKVTGGGSTGGKIPAGRYWRLVIARRCWRGQGFTGGQILAGRYWREVITVS